MDSATQDSNQGTPIIAVRAALDDALLSLRSIGDPEHRVPEVERALAESLRHVYAAMAGRGSHSVFREETRAAVDDVRRALGLLMDATSSDGAAQAVTGKVARCLGELQQVAWQLIDGLELPVEGQSGEYLRATVDRPTLLRLDRRVLRPAVPLDEPPVRVDVPEPEPEVLAAPPMTLEALYALAEENRKKLEAHLAAQADENAVAEEKPSETRSFDAEEDARLRFGAVIDEHALLTERARDALEDLASLGRMRRCTDPEEWGSGEECERRLLTRVDAIAACGVERFPELVRMLDDRPLPDPELTFGNLFFFLSIEGDDAFDQALRILATADLDEPGMMEMVTDAFVFAPHPRIFAAAEEWTTRPAAGWRALGVEVLRRRRTLSLARFDALGSDPDERVIASLAAALPTLPGHPPPGALGWFLQHASERVVHAALRSAMWLQNELGFAKACHIASGEDPAWADAPLFIAIAGGRASRPRLEDCLGRSGAPVVLRALGWYGDPSFVPALLGRLELGDDAAKAAALEALERITGASIVDASIEPEYAREEEPFVGEPREYEPPGLLSNDATAWRAWWERWGGRCRDGVRYRWGRPWSPAQLVHELTHHEFVQRDRPWAALELSARVRPVEPLDWTDLVIRQRAVVSRWGEVVRQRTHTGWKGLEER